MLPRAGGGGYGGNPTPARGIIPGVRVVLAEDQVLLREGVARLLGDAGFEVVERVGDAPALLRAVERHRPDVVITPTTGSRPRSRSAPAGRRSAWWCSPSSSRSATRWSWSATGPTARATC
jgi:hypothetical protein